jgi:hypothetical protein
MDLCTVERCTETPPPELAAGALVFVGFGVTTFVGAGFGVFVGSGVAVGADVAVAVGGNGAAVGGTGVLVAVGSSIAVAVAVGGSGVALGSTVAVGVGPGVAAEHAVSRIARTTGKNLLNTLCILNLHSRNVLQTQNAGTSRPDRNRDAPASLHGEHYALESDARQYVILLSFG